MDKTNDLEAGMKLNYTTAVLSVLAILLLSGLAFGQAGDNKLTVYCRGDLLQRS